MLQERRLACSNVAFAIILFFLSFFLTPRNVLDLASLSGFFLGLFQRLECTLEAPICIWMEQRIDTAAGNSTDAIIRRLGPRVPGVSHMNMRSAEGAGAGVGAAGSSLDIDEDGDGVYHSPWELWALCYGICLLCCWFRVLRSFYLSNIGLIVSIFMAMMADVAQFVVFYVILVLAMSMVFLGVGDPKYLLPEDCDSDSLYMSCRPAYFFMRTLFQSFGEFFLEELDNDASVIFLILTFLVLNIVLMNLLIAMMASTYEKVLGSWGREECSRELAGDGSLSCQKKEGMRVGTRIVCMAVSTARSACIITITLSRFTLIPREACAFMMASRCEQVLEAASAQRLEDTYSLTTEHSRVAMASPLPFNVFLGVSLHVRVVLSCGPVLTADYIGVWQV